MGSLYFSLHEATLSVCGSHLLVSGCFTLVIFWLLDFFPKVTFGVFYGCFCLLVQLLKSRHQDSIMNFVNHLGTVYVLYWGKEGAVLRRKVWDQPALPGAQDGETRHPVAVDAAVAGQMCPPLLCSADTRFTWPGMGEGWALSTYIYHWLHPCIWFSSWLTHVSNCFCTQGISKLKILISSLITSKAIACLFYFFKKFIFFQYLCLKSAATGTHSVPMHKHTEWSKEKWSGSKHFLIWAAVWSNENNKQSLGGAATCPGDCMKGRWERALWCLGKDFKSFFKVYRADWINIRFYQSVLYLCAVIPSHP